MGSTINDNDPTLQHICQALWDDKSRGGLAVGIRRVLDALSEVCVARM